MLGIIPDSETVLLNKVSICHQYQDSSDQIAAIAAENPSINTVWFVYVIDIKCADHSSNNMQEYGHTSQSHNCIFCATF